MKDRIEYILNMVRQALKLTVIISLFLAAVVGLIYLMMILTDSLGAVGIAISAVIIIFVLSMAVVWAFSEDKKSENNG